MEASVDNSGETSVLRIIWLVGWAACWWGVFAVAVSLMGPVASTTLDRVAQGIVVFSLGTFAAAFYLTRSGLARPQRPSVWPWVAVGTALGITALAYFVTGPIAAGSPLAEIGCARMDKTYLAAKIPELLFQQTMIVILLRRMSLVTESMPKILGAYAVIFGVIHIPLIPMLGGYGAALLTASVLSTFAFPPLILRLNWGVAYSFSVHVLAYTAAGAAVRWAA